MTGPTEPRGDPLTIDPGEASRVIEAYLRHSISRQLRRRGAVVGVSGGVDSAVCLALAARALGTERVLALLMPEHDSGPGSLARGREVCERYGVEHIVEDIGPTLDALGCYRRRNDAIRRVFPEFGDDWKCKIAVAENVLDSDRLSYFTLTVAPPGGEERRRRLPADAYLAIVAATNMKQRTRKLQEYQHAERLNYAVIGTPNRLEFELGFFVRGGDGLADVKPIAHLYKTQVYRLAEFLGVPESVCSQPPSTDTFSLPQTQEEFYFALPYDRMDLCLWAFAEGLAPADAAAVLELTEPQVRRVYRDIEAKKAVAARLLRPALTVGEGPEELAGGCEK